MSLKKYFWDLNKQAQIETVNYILPDPEHPKFLTRIVTLLSHCDRPEEVFSVIDKEKFINSWPKIKKYWNKTAHATTFLAWWETIYEQLIKKQPIDKPIQLLIDIGKKIKKARIEKDMTQIDLAKRTGFKQSDISRIEQGKTNITIESLYRILKILKVKQFNIEL